MTLYTLLFHIYQASNNNINFQLLFLFQKILEILFCVIKYRFPPFFTHIEENKKFYKMHSKWCKNNYVLKIPLNILCGFNDVYNCLDRVCERKRESSIINIGTCWGCKKHSSLYLAHSDDASAIDFFGHHNSYFFSLESEN